MLELVFTVCLAATPAHCEERSMLFDDLPLMLCLRNAQIALVTWRAQNPGWEIGRHTCRRLEDRSYDL